MAVASALIHIAFPDGYPILAFRALNTLGDRTRGTAKGPSFCVQYVHLAATIASGANVSIRDLDKAFGRASREAGTDAPDRSASPDC